ncbi:MAG: B12-binding domain-containing radical SAM protein [Gammaproteobacteria bacterium]|nr:B12-binding domain-containing radical SAM protein [Gammaproteobacteria bacterium]
MRLGLIAMSGVRAHNEELTRLGLTLPGFVERNKTIASLPSLGLLTLAGMTDNDVDLDYQEVEDIAKLDELPGDYDVVAISSYSAQINEAYQLADRFRSAGVIVILGGLHVTALPDEALEHADCIVLGEGDPVWPAVVRDLKRRQLRTVYDARGTPFNLAGAPMPRFDLLEPERYNRLTVQTQRGCPFDCEFCAASIRLSPGFRVKPVDKVIAEIRRIREIWPKPFIEFADDNSFVNRKHAKRLLRAIAAEGVRWFTESDISIARDDELLALMRDSGCAQVLIGLESLTTEGLHGIEQKSDWKAKQLDTYMAAIDRIQSHGISVNGCFVLGLDGTGTESFDQVRDFVRASGLHEVQITIQTAFPGTPLYERLRCEHRLLDDTAWELCTLFDVNFRPDRMSVRELEQYFVSLARDLYSEAATKARKRAYISKLRHRKRTEQVYLGGAS